MEVIQSLLVLFILIGLGALSRRANIFQKSDVKVISSFVYYFSLPALFLAKISLLQLSEIEPVIVWGSIVPILLVWIALIVLFTLSAINKDMFILLSLSVIMGSNAFFGLAFFESFQSGSYYYNAVITASLLGAIGIFLSLIMFEFASDDISVKKIFKNLKYNPLLIAIAVGLLFSLVGFRESFLHSSFEMLGHAAGGVAVFSLGIFLYDNFSIEKIRAALFYSLFRFISLPIGLFFSMFLLRMFYVDFYVFETQQFLLLQTAIPAAVALVVLAEVYKYKVSEISGIVILTSLLSFVFMIFHYYLSIIIF